MFFSKRNRIWDRLMRYSKLFDLYRYILMVVSFGFRQACGTWLDRRNESFALSEHKGPRPRYGKWFQVKFVCSHKHPSINRSFLLYSPSNNFSIHCALLCLLENRHKGLVLLAYFQKSFVWYRLILPPRVWECSLEKPVKRSIHPGAFQNIQFSLLQNPSYY